MSQVRATQVAGAPANVTCEAVTLASPMLPGKTTTVETYSILMDQLIPKPKEITQQDVQRVLFTANRNVLSPYRIATASTQAWPLLSICTSLCCADAFSDVQMFRCMCKVSSTSI